MFKRGRQAEGAKTPDCEGGWVESSGNLQLAKDLFESSYGGLVSYLRRALGNQGAMAEDMAQEAITRIAGAKRNYVPERARSLLFSVARNLLIDHFRSERIRTGGMLSLSIVEHDVEAISPLDTLMWREDLERVRAAIIALPPRCQEVFVLSRFEGMSNSAIAKHCAISVSMVEKHMNKALRLLTAAVESTQEFGREVERDATNRAV